MVAEKSIVCRPAGSRRTIFSTSGRKPEVEHLVGLVEHERADVAEVEVPLLRQVDEPARGADDDLDALLEASTCGSYARPP